MKGKTFLILLLAAGVLVALSFYRFGNESRTGEIKMGTKLLADLPVNAVVSVIIADSENRTTLIKGEKVWQIEERNGYPANFDELRDIVVKLSKLKIGRSFSGSPESLVRLSLMTPSDADTSGSGTQIILKDQSGKVLADLVLGQTRETDGGESGGQYLKKADTDTVFLVDGNFRFLKTAPAQWLKKEILNAKADEIATVTCYAENEQEPVYTLSRPEKGGAARMTPVPPGKATDPSKINQVFDALAPLTLDDVRAADSEPPLTGSGRTRLVYRLFDGRQISIFPEFDGKESYTLRVFAELSTEKTEVVDAPEPVDKDGSQPEEKASEPEPQAPAVKSAKQLNEELSPWIFSVKKWQFDSFITQPPSLLEAEKKEGDVNS